MNTQTLNGNRATKRNERNRSSKPSTRDAG